MHERLSSAMKHLAAECADAEPPAEMEAALLAEFEQERRRKKRSPILIATGAIAASVCAFVALEHPPFAKHAAPAMPAPVEQSEAPFVPIPYLAPPAPYERIEVVRMQVPVAALIAAGVPVRTADPGARVEADVMVGQDGRARAVRLVPNSSLN
jgi:ferric-dicitrate binding protein FerR (iron transport regulator)